MPKITLIDGSTLSFDKNISIKDIAKSISNSLAKNAIAGKVDGKLVDTFFIVEDDANVQIITDKDKDGIDIIRHSAAHLLAYAVKILYPNAKYTIGPTIENGFYYDFDYDDSFTTEDLKIIEKKMYELAKANHQVIAEKISREDAINLFTKLNEPYKVEIIKSIPENEKLTLYKEGEYIDLCRGPHVPSTSKIKAFKLLKVSGAYWRGDSKNKMLQRIYGTAWANQTQLDEYLFKLEEAEKRDHRKLAKQLDLFHLQEEAPGMVFWHPKGWTIWQIIEQYLRCELKKEGYLEIKTPMVMNKILWEKSGHWAHYKENMFITESEKHTYAIKPMNCPGHIEVFKNGLKSYRDLPLRLSEFGSCHRNEPSGSLHGLLRVRGFVQDDAHIFCTIDQVIEETKKFHQLITRIYNKFGFNDLDIKLSLRPDKKAGDDALWDKAENNLRGALKACNITWEELEGEGAFYGPKVEYHIKDAIGRSWQCGTIQLDFVLPERLNAEYIDENNTKKHPVMLHRAVLGTLERFIGILIEHYMGNFPLWLAPIQIIIMNITSNQIDYCIKIAKQLEENGFRVKLDTRNEKIGFKIREHSLQKIPYHIIIGDKEVEENTISIRKLGKDVGSIKIEDFILNLNKERV